MIEPQLLIALFADTHAQIKRHTHGLTHSGSMCQPPFGGNGTNWILGHLVVARCNFLMLLDVPSIWGPAACRRYAPGSPPITSDQDAIAFATLRADLDRTQDQLLAALTQTTAGKLMSFQDGKTVGEHLAFYQAHEAFHLGQLHVLRRVCGR